MSIPTSVSGIIHNVNAINVGVSGVIHTVSEGYGGIDGVIHQFWPDSSEPETLQLIIYIDFYMDSSFDPPYVDIYQNETKIKTWEDDGSTYSGDRVTITVDVVVGDVIKVVSHWCMSTSTYDGFSDVTNTAGTHIFTGTVNGSEAPKIYYEYSLAT